MKRNFIEIEKDNGEVALLNVNQITGVSKFEKDTADRMIKNSVGLSEKNDIHTGFRLVINFNNGVYFVKHFRSVLSLDVEYKRIKRALVRW